MPTRCRTWRTISRGKRIRVSHAPPPPAVAAPVGRRGDELVEQVSFRTHDFHPVVTGLLGQAGTTGKILDLSKNLIFGERLGLENIDGRLQCRSAHQTFVKAVPAGVQDLQGDLAAVVMDGRGDEPMTGHLVSRSQLRRVVGHTALRVG